MAQKAIVTLIVSAIFRTRWHQLCGDNWRNYANKHGYDLVILDQPIEKTTRANNRSVAWQKCLIFDLPQVRKYQQIAWIDSDILFNPTGAPPIFEQVPENKVGAVDSFENPSFEENKEALKRRWSFLRSKAKAPLPVEYYSPEDLYRRYGPPLEPLSRMLNAGVMVASPKVHAPVFKHVYENYEERGNPSFYENVPLSFELVKNDMVHWMDPKFNHLWGWSKLLHYPFLVDSQPRSFKDKIFRRIAKYAGNDYEHRVAVACATASLLNCYCLHFAGCANELELVDLTSALKGVGQNIGMQ